MKNITKVKLNKINIAYSYFKEPEEFEIGNRVIYINNIDYTGKSLGLCGVYTISYIGETYFQFEETDGKKFKKWRFIRCDYDVRESFEQGDIAIDRMGTVFTISKEVGSGRTYKYSAAFTTPDYNLNDSVELKLVFRKNDLPEKFKVKVPSKETLEKKGWISSPQGSCYHPVFTDKQGSPKYYVFPGTTLVQRKRGSNAYFDKVTGSTLYSLMDMSIKALKKPIGKGDWVRALKLDKSCPALKLSVIYTVEELIICGANKLVVLVNGEGERLTTNIKFLKSNERKD